MMNDKTAYKTDKIIKYFTVYINDPQLNVWHLSILTAVLTLCYRQGLRRRIYVSRSIIMKLSHINTLPTYHKYFKQLQDFGYISYKPSYHPARKSEVKLHIKRLSTL